ncbi:MAG TPA: peptidylprolyl isomerase [Phycisphaerales bacterium]|nr:peptidylprolyl isomerase [Phycisphaerales bacterium]
MIRLARSLSLVAGAFAAGAFAAQPETSAPPSAPPTTPENPAMVYVTMSTSMGDIKLELDPEKAPITTANFLSYAEKKFYDGTIFHRVMNNFMIQGGGFTADMQQKPTDPTIKNEWKNGLKNVRGSIAMARLGGQADSASSQFFINVQDNVALDTPRDGAGYAVFGKVVDGMDVVDKIKMVATGNKGMHQNVPVDAVTINSVTQTGGPKFSELKAKVDAIAAQAAKDAAADTQKQWDQAMELVKAKGGDVAKGTKTASGLWYTDIAVGEGDSPTPTSVVKVHYTGWLTNGTQFDSSVEKGQPAEFSLTQVVKGWIEGLGSMKPGGKRFLVLPPELGWGERGFPGSPIGPNATTVFQVELLEVKK